VTIWAILGTYAAITTGSAYVLPRVWDVVEPSDKPCTAKQGAGSAQGKRM